MPGAPQPVVEMLWEPHDPHETLRERFGFRAPASAGRWIAATVNTHWDAQIEAVERIVISHTNALAWLASSSGDRLIAKWSVATDTFASLSRVSRFTHWLHVNGLPVSAPLPSLAGCLQVETEKVSMCLQRVVEGDLLDVDDLDQVRAARQVLARLHHALTDYPRHDHILPAYARPQPLAARIASWLNSAGPHVPDAGRTALRSLVQDAPTTPLPVQLVHGDFRSSNIVCVGSRIAAVIDFESARLDHCADELARSAVLLGTRFRDWGPVSPEVRATFLAGYESERALTPVEQYWWNALVLWYTLAFVPPGDDPTGWGSSALGQLAALQPIVSAVGQV